MAARWINWIFGGNPVKTDSGTAIMSRSVTPHDTNDITGVDVLGPCNALYIGVTGNITIVTPEGQDQLYENLAAGVYHPIAATKVKSTGTTATKIVAGWNN